MQRSQTLKKRILLLLHIVNDLNNYIFILSQFVNVSCSCIKMVLKWRHGNVISWLPSKLRASRSTGSPDESITYKLIRLDACFVILNCVQTSGWLSLLTCMIWGKPYVAARWSAVWPLTSHVLMSAPSESKSWTISGWFAVTATSKAVWDTEEKQYNLRSKYNLKWALTDLTVLGCDIHLALVLLGVQLPQFTQFLCSSKSIFP